MELLNMMPTSTISFGINGPEEHDQKTRDIEASLDIDIQPTAQQFVSILLFHCTASTMYFSIFALASAASLASAGCFTGGENWGAERQYALNQATQYCQRLGAGCYQPKGERPKCFNLSSGKKVDFNLQLRDDVVARCIDANECYDGMQKEINGCDHGGNSKYTNWIYTADPNAGNCA
ncbi:hypothetical protein EJ08DRAFT_738867 [Tothia fuscella]|uniref:Glycan binding protein Y3-like domain-containing protein n=1 Tax=Tothia fuscella TaxID=1048955 RepID=A0A9P4NFG5_9PEZI|nr:hypothetical protein EJ08DRAFT_738867 [Tothia fuscella]